MNAALLGLLVVAAPACTFVSCKDYDDDFNKVNNRLDGLDAAKTQVNTEITNLKSSLAETNKKITDLSTKLGDYATKAELNAAVENLNTKIAAAAALETRIKVLEDAKTSLETLVAGKVDQSAFNSKVAEIERKLESASSAATKAISALSTKDEVSKVDKAVQDLKTKVDNQKTTYDAYEARIKALENAGSSNGSADQIEALKKTVTDALSPLRNDLKKLQDANYQTEEQVKAAIKTASGDLEKKIPSVANMLLTGKVSSLVFQPSAFFDGVETIEDNHFAYNPYEGLGNADANGVVVFTKDVDASKKDLLAKYAEANYEVNPSEAKVNLDKANFSFRNLQAANYPTRAAAAEAPATEVTGVKLNNGVITVSFKTNLKELADDSIDIVSLRYTETDEATKTVRVVPSDYVRVEATELTNFLIGKFDAAAKSETDYGKLITSYKFKVDEPLAKQTFEVAHDGAVFKLPENVATYGENLAHKLVKVDKNAASESTLKKAGFHYEYALVKADKDDKSTDAFEINKTTGELKAKYDDKKPYANVGKEGTVRVTLVDEAGNVASVGYFTAKVTLKAQVIAEIESDKALPYSCPTDGVGDVTFSLEKVNEFLANKYQSEWKVWRDNSDYKFLVADDLKQYTLKDGVATEVKDAKGTIDAVQYGKSKEYPAGYVTLKNLLRADVADSLKKTGDQYSTIIRVVKSDASNKPELQHTFYVRLVWKPKTVQAAPTVTFTGEKKAAQWKNDAIHVHADIIQDVTNGKHVTFEQDVTAGFTGTLVSTISAKDYPNYTVTSKWVFVEPRVKTAVGQDGKTYTLGVNKDGSEFVASLAGKSEVIATISPAGLVAFNDKSDFGKNLLNAFNSKQLADGETLTGRVAYVTTDRCGGIVKSTNENAFDVKFIRPLNVKDEVLVKTFTDGVKREQSTGAQNFHTSGNFVTDWRDYTTGGQDKQEQFFNTYDIKVFFAPKEQWLTDFTGSVKTFKDAEATKNFDLDFEALTGAGAIAVPTAGADGRYQWVINNDHWNGSFKYTTKTANVKEFNIWLPATVEYKWGKFNLKFKFVVKPTVNQPNARRK